MKPYKLRESDTPNRFHLSTEIKGEVLESVNTKTITEWLTLLNLTRKDVDVIENF